MISLYRRCLNGGNLMSKLFFFICLLKRLFAMNDEVIYSYNHEIRNGNTKEIKNRKLRVVH